MAHVATPAGPGGEGDPRPAVAMPRTGPAGALIAALAAVFAVLLFLALNARRVERTQARSVEAKGAAFTDPLPLTVPPEAAPRPFVVPVPPRVVAESRIVPRIVLPRSVPPAPPPLYAPPPSVYAPATPLRPAGPALVYDGGAPSNAGAAAPASTLSPAAQAAAQAANDDTPIGTAVIRHQADILPTGTVISATLETPIDSTRAGLIRAVVAEDARGFDGKRVLIPRGSRLIGEYAADIRVGQKRVLVTWTRLIRPDGVAIRIGSPGADALGGTGVPGRVNSFFLQRFASAVLQSALSVAVNLASRREQGSVFVDLPNGAGGAGGQSLLASDDIKPRIRVRQGAVVTVFVAHDLDFSAAPVLSRGQP